MCLAQGHNSVRRPWHINVVCNCFSFPRCPLSSTENNIIRQAPNTMGATIKNGRTPKWHPWIQTPTPPKYHKNEGFLSNSGPDPLKNHSYHPSIQRWPSSISSPAKRHFDAIQMAFRWRPDDGPLIVVSGSNLSSSFKNKQRKKAVIVGPPLTKTVWIRTCRTDSVVYNAYNLQQICPQNDVVVINNLSRRTRHAAQEGGGTLIFSYTRRLRPFLGVQKFQFQYVLWFSEKWIFLGVWRFCGYFGGLSLNWTIFKDHFYAF